MGGIDDDHDAEGERVEKQAQQETGRFGGGGWECQSEGQSERQER